MCGFWSRPKKEPVETVEARLHDVATRLETVTDKLSQKVEELRTGGDSQWPKVVVERATTNTPE
jgi:hypothetical protein